jgi:type IV pilus assembly protein PilO
MAMQTGLEGKPWWYGLAVGAVLAAVILGIVWWQFIDPLDVQIAGQEARLEELQKKIIEGRAAKAQLPQFREQVRTLELELDKLLRILPSRRNTPDLLRRVRSLAEQGDFGFRRFTPGGFVEREFFSEWPIRIDLTGGYHNLAMFFDRVSRLSRIINIENLNIQAANRAEVTITATFTAKTFIYKEPESDEAAGTTAPSGG